MTSNSSKNPLDLSSSAIEKPEQDPAAAAPTAVEIPIVNDVGAGAQNPENM